MALAVKSGVLYNNAYPWVDYYVLDTYTPDVYKVYLTNDVVQLQIEDVPEDNTIIVDDDNPDVSYYLGVTSGILHLVPGQSGSTDCPNLCEMINEQGVKLDSLAIEIVQMRAVIEEINDNTEDNNALLGGLEAAPAEWSIVG